MRNLLISVLVNVGDVIMMTSVFDLIKQRFPTTRITALARPEAVDLFKNNPVVDDVICYAYRSGSLFHGLGAMRRVIAAGNFDTYLSLDRRFRSALLAYLAGIKTRIGPDMLFEGFSPKLWTRFLYSKRVHLSVEECRGNLVEMFHWVARRGLSIEGRGEITLPPVSLQRMVWARDLFQNAKGPVIGFCVKTNEPRKTWPAAGFVELLQRLKSECNAFCYIIGSPGDRDYIDRLLDGKSSLAINLAGRTALMDLAALAPRSDLYIGLDNGAAHVMANSGLPKMICIFITTTPENVVDSLKQAKLVRFSELSHREPDRLAAEVDTLFQMAMDLLKPEESV